MTPQHHISTDLLTDYAAGAMSEPVALLVATHLALCPQCRAQVQELEAVGGALLESIDPVSVEDDTLRNLLDQLDATPPDSAPSAGPVAPQDEDPLLPQPLRGYVGRPLSEIRWRGLGGFNFTELEIGAAGTHTRLMRIAAGAAMPRHTHAGQELTLVLSGGFSDATGHYIRGDVSATDPSIDHRPIADAGEDCLCLAVTDAPLKLTGPVGRIVNPLFRF